MDCNVIMDLLPLYADDCCSDQSRRIVEEHIGSCKMCKKAFDSMSKEVLGESCEISVPAKISRISQFKASLIQSVALFVSFALIILGVTLESKTLGIYDYCSCHSFYDVPCKLVFREIL